MPEFAQNKIRHLNESITRIRLVEIRDRLHRSLKPGGVLVSVVSRDPLTSRLDVRTASLYFEVTTERLNTISKLFERQPQN